MDVYDYKGIHYKNHCPKTIENCDLLEGFISYFTIFDYNILPCLFGRLYEFIEYPDIDEHHATPINILAVLLKVYMLKIYDNNKYDELENDIINIIKEAVKEVFNSKKLKVPSIFNNISDFVDYKGKNNYNFNSYKVKELCKKDFEKIYRYHYFDNEKSIKNKKIMDKIFNDILELKMYESKLKEFNDKKIDIEKKIFLLDERKITPIVFGRTKDPSYHEELLLKSKAELSFINSKIKEIEENIKSKKRKQDDKSRRRKHYDDDDDDDRSRRRKHYDDDDDDDRSRRKHDYYDDDDDRSRRRKHDYDDDDNDRSRKRYDDISRSKKK